MVLGSFLPTIDSSSTDGASARRKLNSFGGFRDPEGASTMSDRMMYTDRRPRSIDELMRHFEWIPAKPVLAKPGSGIHGA